ncbi:hypothetical protein CDG77_02235 [Nostoc sp. 'Peltigera membranacea cyanobiont' 213]|nr:hypothetical protein CDG77_02235 [Nostoc sp. 'Peltigera membranacea cyanobiont' 213]
MFSSPLVVQIPPSMQMTDEQFFDFCEVNRELRYKRMFEKSLVMYQILLDPPKSPDNRYSQNGY